MCHKAPADNISVPWSPDNLSSVNKIFWWLRWTTAPRESYWQDVIIPGMWLLSMTAMQCTYIYCLTSNLYHTESCWIAKDSFIKSLQSMLILATRFNRRMGVHSLQRVGLSNHVTKRCNIFIRKLCDHLQIVAISVSCVHHQITTGTEEWIMDN